MNTDGHFGGHMVDAGAAVALVAAPWWWPVLNSYGQLLLLVLGIAVALLRAAVLIRDLRRGK